MNIEIDQSGKIEETNKPSIIAFSNNQSGSVILLAKDKRILQKYFRAKNKSRMFIFFTFAVLIYVLTKDIILNHRITIDQEYVGHEDIIKSLILDIFDSEQTRINKEDIIFKEIGKKSKAHTVAVDAFRLKKADQKVSSSDIIKIISKLKKKNRVQFGYLNTV